MNDKFSKKLSLKQSPMKLFNVASAVLAISKVHQKQHD